MRALTYSADIRLTHRASRPQPQTSPHTSDGATAAFERAVAAAREPNAKLLGAASRLWTPAGHWRAVIPDRQRISGVGA